MLGCTLEGNQLRHCITKPIVQVAIIANTSGFLHQVCFNPRKVVEWAMTKLGVEEWLVRAVMAMYKHARTRIRSYGGSVSEWFGVNVGVHQGSVLSPLLLIIVMEAVTHSVREGLPWEMLYADDLVLVGKCEES